MQHDTGPQRRSATSKYASLLLQHGATPEFIRKSMPRTADGVAEEAIGTLLDLLKKEGIIP